MHQQFHGIPWTTKKWLACTAATLHRTNMFLQSCVGGPIRVGVLHSLEHGCSAQLLRLGDPTNSADLLLKCGKLHIMRLTWRQDGEPLLIAKKTDSRIPGYPLKFTRGQKDLIKSGQIWSLLIKSGQILSNLNKFGQIRSDGSSKFDQLWPNLIKFYPGRYPADSEVNLL